MPRPTARPRPRLWPPAFLAHLAGGQSVRAAARAAGIARSAVYARRAADTGFAAAWAEAEEEGVQLLEDEVRRRAVEGVLRPVYHAGVKVGQVRERSDTLLIFLLKARRPGVYRDTRPVARAGDPAAPARPVPGDPRALTDAELDRRIAALEAAGPAGEGCASPAGRPEAARSPPSPSGRPRGAG